MSPQPEQGSSRKAKLLACTRCRHRKQKCTEARPCENCIQSGVECIPAQPAHSKAPLDPEYVRRLEERIAQLETLIPQESLDHINSNISQKHAPLPQNGTRPTSAPTNELPNYHENILPHQLPDLEVSLPAASTPPVVLNPALFGALSDMPGHGRPVLMDHVTLESLGIDRNTERFLIHTYFDMAHSQYPFLLKHQILQLVESWHSSRNDTPETMWHGFFVYMVYATALLMTKARINGPSQSQKLYSTATSKYLPFLVASPDPMIRAQGFLLLAIYALHMPSLENIIALSSWTIRFCVMSQFHLTETEPLPIDAEALINIQHRRRVFWCAYAVDRAVCSSYDLPFSVPNSHITVPVFENLDDDQLLVAAASASPGSQLVGYEAPTALSTALHVLASRQLEAEVQEMVLSRDFVTHSDEAFVWRAGMLEKLKEWNRQSSGLSRPSQKGYVSPGWLKMIYYYNIVMLYRPTRLIAYGAAGDWSVQACCQSLLFFRRFQMAREIAQPWLGLLTQFQMGVTLLYCFFATPVSRWKPSYKSADVSDAIRACASTLAILAERWTEAECIRDVFETLAREIPMGEGWERPISMSDAGRRNIEENWKRMSKVVIHRPTLRMIHEMATDNFVEDESLHLNEAINMPSSPSLDLSTSLADDIDLDWVGQNGDSSFDGAHFDRELGRFSGQIYGHVS